MILKYFRNLRYLGIALLCVAQVFCAFFFLYDIVDDYREKLSLNFHLWIELCATITLFGAMIIEFFYFQRLFMRQRHLEQNTKVAAGAFYDVLETYFNTWALTPAERDVALFTIKGLSLAEVAQMRGSKVGTIKAQLNAIYRKANVEGRMQLISLLIEEIITTPKSEKPNEQKDKEAPSPQPSLLEDQAPSASFIP